MHLVARILCKGLLRLVHTIQFENLSLIVKLIKDWIVSQGDSVLFLVNIQTSKGEVSLSSKTINLKGIHKWIIELLV